MSFGAAFFISLVGIAALFISLDGVAACTDSAADADRELLRKQLEQTALGTFVDAHNTSYYVNSYTTKVNPTMDGVLCKLLDGVRRLRDEWQDREARREDDCHDGATPQDEPRDGTTPPGREQQATVTATARRSSPL